MTNSTPADEPGDFNQDDAERLIAELEAFLAGPDAGPGKAIIDRRGHDSATMHEVASVQVIAATATAVATAYDATVTVVPAEDVETPISRERALAAGRWARRILGETADEATKKALNWALTTIAGSALGVTVSHLTPIIQAVEEALRKLGH